MKYILNTIIVVPKNDQIQSVVDAHKEMIKKNFGSKEYNKVLKGEPIIHLETFDKTHKIYPDCTIIHKYLVQDNTFFIDSTFVCKRENKYLEEVSSSVVTLPYINHKNQMSSFIKTTTVKKNEN